MFGQWQHLCDELGPHAIVLVHEPELGLRGVVVVDEVSAGPAIGGIRMAPDVTVEEVARLARAMTLKNAAAGLPHGGAKAGIAFDPGASPEERERRIRAFARAIAPIRDYIPGPDMGTSETDMAFIVDEGGRAAGLPAVLGGIPLDVIGATGFGLAIAAEAAQDAGAVALDGARVVVQGFGSVGKHAARFLVERGATIVAVADSRGAVSNPDGLELPLLLAHKDAGEPVSTFAGGTPISAEALVAHDCEIWIPAARPDVLDEGNAGSMRCKLILQGANIPATAKAEAMLEERGVLSVPDFIANAGGVICAAVEVAGGSRGQAMQTIAEKVRENTRAVIEDHRERGVSTRRAALDLARARVDEARRYRRRL